MDDETSSDDARLRALGEKLRDADPAREAEVPVSGMAMGMKYASEFAGAIIVTVFFGILLDRFVGTSPWGLLGGLALGTAAGVYTIVRSASQGMD